MPNPYVSSAPFPDDKAEDVGRFDGVASWGAIKRVAPRVPCVMKGGVGESVVDVAELTEVLLVVAPVLEYFDVEVKEASFAGKLLDVLTGLDAYLLDAPDFINASPMSGIIVREVEERFDSAMFFR